MKRIGHLWETLVSDENLYRAVDEVNRTHHWLPGHRPNKCTAWVERTRDARVQALRDILTNCFHPNPPKVKRRYDAAAKKWRTISEPKQWPDQYVHHALVQFGILTSVVANHEERSLDVIALQHVQDEGRGFGYGTVVERQVHCPFVTVHTPQRFRVKPA